MVDVTPLSPALSSTPVTDREVIRHATHDRVVLDAWGLWMLADKLLHDDKLQGGLDEMRRRAQRLADHLGEVLDSLR